MDREITIAAVCLFIPRFGDFLSNCNLLPMIFHIFNHGIGDTIMVSPITD
jgi:hypothetical protein